MRENRRIKLPDHPLGNDRCMEIEFGYHDDLNVSIWNGEPDYDDDNEPTNLRSIQFAHGSDVTLVACMIGYYVRLGIDADEIRAVFRQAAESVLADEVDEADMLYDPEPDTHRLDYCMKGEDIPLYDRPDMNWRCLHEPMPRVPGVVSRVGGTTLYTREDILGHVGLLFVYFSSISQRTMEAQPEYIEVLELYKPDIPLVAGALCELSGGVYREDIARIVKLL